MRDLHYFIGEDFGNCTCGNCTCKVGYTGVNCGKKDCDIAAEDCLSANGVSRELTEWPAPHSKALSKLKRRDVRWEKIRWCNGAKNKMVQINNRKLNKLWLIFQSAPSHFVSLKVKFDNI